MSFSIKNRNDTNNNHHYHAEVRTVHRWGEYVCRLLLQLRFAIVRFYSLWHDTPRPLSLHLGLESIEARKVTIWCIGYGIVSKIQNEFVQPCRVEHGVWVINRGKLYSDTTTTSTLRQTCQKFIFIRNEFFSLSKNTISVCEHNFGECKQVRKQKRKKRKHFVAVSSLWP